MAGRFLPSALIVLAVAAGCSDDAGDGGGVTAPSTTSTATADTTTTDDTTTDDTTTSTTVVAEAEGTDLADGAHDVALDAVDVEGRSVTVDVLQFLTGDEAVEAYRAATPDDPEGVPPNDYFIVNENPRLRTLRVVDGASVEVLADPGGPELVGAGLEDLVGRERSAPFVLELEGGEVVGITQRYLP